MNAQEIIWKKRNHGSLTREEIMFFVHGYCRGEIPDYQMSALLMAIYFNGLREKELLNFTKEMIRSGRSIDLSFLKKPLVDKHSTGGVGDKVSLIVGPVVASYGVLVPMIAGRALGFTGGTLDKLESIPGFRTRLSIEEFVSNLEKIGLAIIGQTDEIVPADRKIYALREVTSTIDSLPLIASSIMSKKLAGGSKALVLDVKVGRGAFVKKLRDARELARVLVNIGKSMSCDAVAIMSDMNSPLGRYVGNAMEVLEAVEVLKGKGEGRLVDLSTEIGAWMLKLAGLCKTLKDGRSLCEAALKNGSGLKKFKEMLIAQSGEESVLDKPEVLNIAKNLYEYRAVKGGYVAKIDALAVGEAVMLMGAGRERMDDSVDHSVGIYINRTVGEPVKEGEPVLVLHYNDRDKLNRALDRLTGAVQYSRVKPMRRPVIYGIVS